MRRCDCTFRCRSPRPATGIAGCHNAAPVDPEGGAQRSGPVREAEEGPGAHAESAPSVGPRVDRESSSLRFIYPFTFEGDTIALRSESIDSATWRIGEKSIAVWQPDAFPTDDLLSEVADFVDPQAGSLVSAGRWRVDDTVLRSPSGLGGGASHPGADWTLTTRRGPIPFLIESIELALFRHGVGFVILSALPVSTQLRDWFTFVHFFRYVHGRRASEVSAVRTTGRDGDGESVRSAFFPPLDSAASDDGQPPETHVFGEVIDHLLASAAVADERPRWWEEIFVTGMMLPHVALFVDQCPADDMPIHLHRLRNFFHADQAVHPSAEELALADPGLLPYAANQWFFYSLNGGGFLACDAPRTPFFRSTLPEHLRGAYLLLFLLALDQRFTLMFLSQQVSREWVAGGDGDDARKVAAFRRIRDALLAFTAQGYFAQTMQEEHHHRSYARWQAVFQLELLYRNVADEVREMYGDLELRQRDRAESVAREQQRQAENLDRRINVVTWLLGVPVSLLLVINASGNIALVRKLLFGPAGVQAYDVLIGVALDLLGIAVGYIVYRTFDRRLRREQDEKPRDGEFAVGTHKR